jgi:transcriptional regulator with XRE-family HTH domain
MPLPNVKSPNPVDAHVGSRIRMRRLLLGMSQEKLGESLGITFQQVQKYEKGTNRVGASRLQAISDTLAVAPSFFFEGMEGAPSATSGSESAAGDIGGINSFISSKEGLDLNRAFVKIDDPKLRKKIVAMVRALASDSDREANA